MRRSVRRRFLLALPALIAAASWTPEAVPAASRGTRLILLGTKGGPRVAGSGRSNPANLLLINGTPYVVDCGSGVSRQLAAAGVALNKLRFILLTHHHSDHNLEYGGLIYNAWATGLGSRIDAYGPPGLEDMTRAFFEYMKFDIDTRIADEGRPDLRKLVAAHDVVVEGARPVLVLQNDDVKITAITVRHPPIKHAYAYRFDTKDRSIVISGDTTYAPELAGFAQGADVLVHEVMYLPGLEAILKRVPNATTLREHLLASHTVPEDAGKIAAAAGVKTLVLSHLVPGDDPSITDEMWTAGVREHFKGRVVVGADLMEID
ncbi:MAG TPA: MBL fold metallo-hydrolase [Burkholderiaceae bacterium]|nr:MBL fold metallo-hydrolase [Burkholderiaceae bacterium]